MPVAWQKSASVCPGAGEDRLDASGVDFRHMPVGMFSRQLDITSPNTRTGTPRPRRGAAPDSPYGPAPMTTADRLIGPPSLGRDSPYSGELRFVCARHRADKETWRKMAVGHRSRATPAR